MTMEFEVSRRQCCEMSETLMEKEHIAKVLQAQLDAKLVTISQMQTKHSDEVKSLQQSIQELATEKEQLLTRILEVDAAENTATDETDPAKPATECIDNANERSWAATKTQKLRSAVEQMIEKLAAVESELADAKTTLRSTEHSSEPNELMIALDQLKLVLDNIQQAGNSLLTDFVEQQEQIVKVSSPDDPNTDSLDCSEKRYNALKEDFERVTEELEHVSHERNDCMEELRALEAQLMQVSEEKMKCAIAADEQEYKLREAQQVVLSSSATITTLQAQLEDTQSTKATLEASKVELEQNMKNLQIAWTTLQADHAAIVEQIQHGNTGLKSENESSATEPEHLQQRLEYESKQREKLQLDVQSYEETLSVLRKEAKDNSDTIADLSEKIRILESDLDSAASTQQQKDKEYATLRNALTMSEEEKQEMRLQSKQRLVAAEGKEMALQDRISALELQLKMSSTGVDMAHAPLQNDVELELMEARAKQAELQSKSTALENHLSEARQELLKQDDEWKKKEALAKTELALVAAQAQQANYQGKLKEIEAQLEVTENEVTRNRHELKSLAESLKSAQMEAVNNHNKQVEVQLAKESMEKLVERQKARIDKLDKVKMTTETLELFRKLKKARSDLQEKVQDLQKDLAQALSRSRGDQLENEHLIVKRKEEELKLLKEQVGELRKAIRQARDDKATMRVALNDEREKAEHEIQEMQTLVKEKMELVENLESQLASVEDAMAKLQEQKSDNVSYLEKENFELHVENRELKKQLALTSLPKKDEGMGDTGTYDVSAAAAVEVLGEDRFRFNTESKVDVVDCAATTETSARPQEARVTKAGGFLLSTTEMDATAAYSQDEPKEGEQPECSQQ
ncbi:hypothetical protein DD237_004398 [Peronospora effusa]|uniref:Uncharacterized protein n=1 Tax=Peronospora effusa TaxID=542832 RepID=A0A425CDJ2_9STRA|nr:hypothetical protein DD237_004398 [Peronospora effusa]